MKVTEVSIDKVILAEKKCSYAYGDPGKRICPVPGNVRADQTDCRRWKI